MHSERIRVSLRAEKKRHKSSTFVICTAQKTRYTACISSSRLKFGQFCKHRLQNSLQNCLFLLNYPFLQYFITIEKTNKRYADRAKLPVTIWVYLCGVRWIIFLTIVSGGICKRLVLK